MDKNLSKLNINWFPGHMKKTLDELERDIKNIDAVLYVLDARAYLSCLNPKIDEIVKNKIIIYVINKTDLVDENKQKEIEMHFKSLQKNAICISATEKSAQKLIILRLKAALKEKFDNAQRKGVVPIFKVMVIGTPNTGKSSLINSLCGQKKTNTGDKAGVTKSKQWVRINDNFALLDTPGTLWPNMNDDNVKQNLAFIGGIKKDVLEESELGYQFFLKLLKGYKNIVKDRYKVTDFNKEPIEIYDEVLKKMGAIMRGGEVDYEKGGKKILEDFRSGRLGKVSLD